MTARLLVLCVLIAFSAVARAQQPTVSSSLQGRVVKWGTTEPIPKATVELQRVEAGSAAPYVATTGPDGTFEFVAVRPGQYRISSTRPGYVKAEYGQRWPNGVGSPITIPPGRAVSNVPVPMLPTVAISGRVHDRSDQPIGNVEVQALKTTYQDGRRVLTRVQSAVSDDRGEYRLFWLPPGRYYVSARHPDLGDSLMRFGGLNMGGGMGPNGVIQYSEFRNDGDNAGATMPMTAMPIEPRTLANVRERFVPVYFPNTTDEQAAAGIELAPGAEQIGTDFTLEPVTMQRVRGRVVYESNGEPAMSARVQWVSSTGASAPATGFLMLGPRTAATPVECCDGSFELALPPGAYTLVAAVNNLNARVGVQVGYADVDGVVMPLGQSFSISGRVTFEGRAPTPAELNALRVSLAMNPPVPALQPDSYSVILPNGSLTLSAGRGDFRLSISPLLNVTGGFQNPQQNPPASLSNWYVKSVRLGDADVLNGGLHLDGRPDAPLEIVIGTTPGSVEGVVVDQNRAPVPNVTVSLLPDLARRGRTDLYKSVSTDANGRFKIERVPPGDYVAFAWDGIESGDWQNPEFVAPHEAQGARLRVPDGTSTAAELTIIPPPR